MTRKKTNTTSVPDNPGGLWRHYSGSRLYHRYTLSQLNSSWQRQEALCGRVTKTGNGSFSKLGPVPYGKICRKCQAILASKTESK